MEVSLPPREDFLPGGLADQFVPHGARSTDTELQYPFPGAKDVVYSNLEPAYLSKLNYQNTTQSSTDQFN